MKRANKKSEYKEHKQTVHTRTHTKSAHKERIQRAENEKSA